MSRIAWFNCSVGTAGDMTLAALVDAGADAVQVGAILAGLGLSDYALTFEKTQRAGVVSTRAIVAVHDHDHHEHSSWKDIRGLLESADLPERVRHRSLKVFGALAEVEAVVHGVNIDEVGFHEVGAIDSIVDIVGACAALEVLDVERIVCSAIGTGHGSISTQHGVVPNPAPATTALCALRNAPMIGLDDSRELATPTGVALMTVLADSFGSMPAMHVVDTGYGAGSGDFVGRANVVKVVIGEQSSDSVAPGAGQSVRLLECNVDDVTGEVVAHTIAALLTAGAHDAWATPIVMKKGRPAFTVHVLCDTALTETMSVILVRETGTLGLRGSIVERWPQTRAESVVVVDGHEIRVKIAGTRVKVEHDDAVRAAAALGLPLREVMARAEHAAR